MAPAAVRAQYSSLKYNNFNSNGTFVPDRLVYQSGYSISPGGSSPNITGQFSFQTTWFSDGGTIYDETVDQAYRQGGGFGTWQNNPTLNALGGASGISGFFYTPNNSPIANGTMILGWDNYNHRPVLPNTTISIWDPGTTAGIYNPQISYQITAMLNGNRVNVGKWMYQLINPYGDTLQSDAYYKWDPATSTLTVSDYRDGRRPVFPARVFVLNTGVNIFDHLQIIINGPNTDHFGISIQMPGAVPEPGVISLLGLGGLVLMGMFCGKLRFFRPS
jgi:hypothetical protein